jgi:acyl-CoA dehydrogenase
MDFDLSPVASKLRDELLDFMQARVYPSEAVFQRQMLELADPHADPPVLAELQREARRRGLWNLFLPHKTQWTEGLSNVDYAPLAEILGRSPIASDACNCFAPDTGNMEILTMFGTPEQKERWLGPLLEFEIRSAFAMTEPAVASSDATNIETSIRREGDEYVINGRKWWISGAGRPSCKILIVMGKTDPAAERHRQQSMVLVPVGTPGVTVMRNLPVFGFVDRESHCEIDFSDVRVPVSNILGEEGGGFAIAQARLGPGRVHHAMRAIGAAERALEMMCQRTSSRIAFGGPISAKETVQDWIADARVEIDQARLYTLYAAWLMDRGGNKAAATEIAGIKVAVPQMALRVIDHAIQAYGAAGVGPDAGLAQMWAHTRILRIADGPDEVHRRTIARRELRRHASAQPSAGS